MPNNIAIYRGGSPVLNYMWKEGDFAKYTPPFQVARGHDIFKGTPPYDSHGDGAYNLGDFVIGMPINPNGRGMIWQKKALLENGLAVGDIIQYAWVPRDHFATMLNFKCIESDQNMAGATVALVCQDMVGDAQGNFTYTEDSDFDAAVTAQLGSNSIAIDEPFNKVVSLYKVTDGYARPLYSEPDLPAGHTASASFGKVKVLGLKILSLPTKPEFSLADMLNAMFLSVRFSAFECPTNLG